MVKNILDKISNDLTSGFIMILLISKPKTGKTHMINYLLKNIIKKRLVDECLIFYSNDKIERDYWYLPSKCRYSVYKENILQNYINELIAHKEKTGKFKKSVIVFDDQIMQVKNTANFVSILSNFRHYGVSIFFVTQQLKKENSVFRRMLNYAIIFKHLGKESKDALYEAFGSDQFKRPEKFRNYLSNVTNKRYRMLIFDADAYNDSQPFQVFTAPAKLPNIKFIF